MSLLAVDILKVAEKSWNDLDVLEELNYELTLRTSKASKQVQQSIQKRMSELQSKPSEIESDISEASNLKFNNHNVSQNTFSEGIEKDNQKVDLDISLVDLVNYMDVSARLKNIITREYGYQTLPVNTVREYLKLESPLSVFTKKTLFGNKTSRELYEMIQVYISEGFVLPPLDLRHDTSKIDENILSLSLLDLTEAMGASVRLINALALAESKGLLPASTLGEYLNLKNPYSKFIKLENAGKKTINELDDIISSILSQDVAINIKKHKETDSIEEVEFASIDEAVKSILSDKEIHILVSRGIKKQTLEEIGQKLEVTRERVRQVEKKAILKLIKRLSLDQKVLSFESKMVDCGGGLPLEILKESLGASRESTFIIAHAFTYIGKPKKILNDNLSFKEIIENNSLWNSILSDYFFKTSWPINVEELKASISAVPFSYVLSFIERKGGVFSESKDEITYFSKFPFKFYIYQVFIKEKNDLHFSELTKKINHYFNLEKGERDVHALIGRMPEALIVDRGTYNIYENIGANQFDIERIVQDVEVFLQSKQDYVSVQIIFDEVFRTQRPEWLKGYYILFGVLQDYGDFVIRRGLMVGLNEFKKDFKPISEEVADVIKLYGPITASGIQERLSNTRKFFANNIDIIVSKDNSILKSDFGVYDSFERVIKSNDKYSFLVTSMELSLYESPTLTDQELEKKIKTVESNIGIVVNKYIVAYVASRETDKFNIKDGVISLNKCSQEVKDYFAEGKPDSAFLRKFDPLRVVDKENDLLDQILGTFS